MRLDSDDLDPHLVEGTQHALAGVNSVGIWMSRLDLGRRWGTL